VNGKSRAGKSIIIPSITSPGTNIILDSNDRIAFGVYADTFGPSEGVLVYKLFIVFRHHTLGQAITEIWRCRFYKFNNALMTRSSFRP